MMRSTRMLPALLMVLSPIWTTPTLAQVRHELRLEPQNIHWGYYDASIEPVVRIRSGDTVYLETLLARGLERLAMAGADRSQFPAAMVEVENAVTERGPGPHPLTGPIFVEGAEPGDVLEVRILEVDVMMPVGVSGFLPAGGTLPDDFPYGGLQLFELDVESGVAHMGPDITIPMRPFFGSLGVAPTRSAGACLERPSRPLRRQYRQQGADCRDDALPAGARARRATVDRGRACSSGRR